MSTDFDYWEESQYLPICKVCNNRVSNGWCSESCWNTQRKQKFKYNFLNNNIFTDTNFDDLNVDNTSSSAYKDEYTILEIIPPTTNIEIKKQYYKLSLKYHPDKVIGKEEQFIKVCDAYNTLICN
tara:strand:+ start:4674 stop:5048 length:375 start_codon:yes stop_codon:yes gene_type:complete